MAKKKLPLSIFEIVWYSICILVMIWGLVYVVLSLIDGANDLTSLHKFMADFKKTFGLSMYFWGLIICAIGVLAGVTVMIIYAKTFDKAADREQRRSARLSGIIKKEDKVVAEQQPEVVEEPKEEKPAEEPQAEQPVEEKAPEQKPEQPVEEPVKEEAPAEDAPAEQPAEEKAE